MSRYDLDKEYEQKFVCINRKDVLKSLNGGELHQLDMLLDKIAKTVGYKEYLCVNQDEPYADKVWELIKEHEKKEIVAFIGRAGSGKDYQCKLLEEKGYQKVALADALRDIAYNSLGINSSMNVDYDWLKSNDCIYVYDKDDDYIKFNFRYFLEHLGTQGIRKYDNDFWCRALIKTLEEKKYKKVCISDMRFINEYEYLKRFAEENGYEFKVVFCNYRSDRYQDSNTHESARLSNYFCTHGYTDLEELSDRDFEMAKKDLCN